MYISFLLTFFIFYSTSPSFLCLILHNLISLSQSVRTGSLVAPPGTKKRKRSPSRDRRLSWVGGNVTEVGRRQAGSFGSSGHPWRGQEASWSCAAFTHNRSSSGRGGNAGRRGERDHRGHRGHRGGHSGHAATLRVPL